MAAVGAAIGAFFTTVGTWYAGLTVVSQILVRLAVSIAASALLQALAPKPRQPGIKTRVTQVGGQNPVSFVLMTYATAGSRACPPMSHGQAGDTPNAYLTEVIELGDIPGQQLSRVIIDDQYVTLGTTPHPDYGLPVLGDLEGFAWIKYYDGTQIAADPMLLAKYGAYPERPWSADMVGTGLCYAICTFKFSRQKWRGIPRVRFELAGIPLYDPRLDSTVGGSGSHLWADPATWAPTTNPMVAAYNVMRGIALPDGSTWGGGIDAADLPLDGFFAAMNECDLLVDDGAAGTEAQFCAGAEVGVDEEPADILAELMKVCSGQMAEVGGVWKPRAGPVGLPSFSLADADIIATQPAQYTAFPGFDRSYNGVHASYPEPEQLWNAREAPPAYNAAWEAEDQDQRLVADLALPFCPYGAQVRRLMHAYIEEERRFRRHVLTLPPDAVVLEPLDAIAWTSAEHGYTARVFEIAEVTDDPMTGLQRVTLRERDPADYVYPALASPATVSPALVTPAAQTVPGFAAAGVTVLDASGTVRGPGIEISWTAAEAADVELLRWELRPVSQAFTLRGTADVAAGAKVIAEGVVRAGAYEVRAELIADRPTAWTAWTAVTAPDVGSVVLQDLAEETFIGNLRADFIGVGKMNARHLEVTELLEIDAGNAGLSLGKVSAYDQSVPGIFFGTTALSSGFGFLAGRISSLGNQQYLQITDDTALRIANAQFRVGLTAAPSEVTVTTSQTIVLPVGTPAIDLKVLGGGGGGGSGDNPSVSPAATSGGNGGTTTVQLYDGTTLIQTWTSVGGVGRGTFLIQPQGGGPGDNSTLGAGGAPGIYNGAAAQSGGGYGSGGGGGNGDYEFNPGVRAFGYGAQGGGAAPLVEVSNYDISALANPKLTITIGAAGIAGISGEVGKPVWRDGGNGAPGVVKYTAYTAPLMPADVVPLSATSSGTFANTGGGSNNFPNLGAGLWILHSRATTNLALGLVQIDNAGREIDLTYQNFACFVSDMTPLNYVPNSFVRTIYYQHFSMGNWGGT